MYLRMFVSHICKLAVIIYQPPKLNHQKIQYHSALGFYNNSIQLAKRIDQNIGNEGFEISSPAAVNLSFAIELLLKLIYNITTGEIIKSEHRLDIIYSKIEGNIQKEIEREFEYFKTHSSEKLYPIKFSFNSFQNNPEDIHDKQPRDLSVIELLDLHSNGFVKWRYLYEVKDEYYSYEFDFEQLNSFAKALIKTINAFLKL